MAIRSDHLCTLAQLETILGTNAAEVAVREQAIDRATEAVHSWLDRKVIHNPALATSVTELLDVDSRTEVLFLNEWPVPVSLSLSEDSDRVFATALTINVDYLLYADEGRVEKIQGDGVSIKTGQDNSYFIPGRQTVKAIYTPGYTDLASVPLDINQGCLEWAIFVLNQQRASGMREATMSLKRLVFTSSIPPPHVQTLLAPHRKIQVAGI